MQEVEVKENYKTIPILKDFLERIIIIWKNHHLLFNDYYIEGHCYKSLGFVETMILPDGRGEIGIHRRVIVGFDLTPTTQMTEEKYAALDEELMNLMTIYRKKGIQLKYKIINPFYFKE